MNTNLGRMVAAFSTFRNRRPYWCPVACHPVAEWAFLGPTAPNRGGLKFRLRLKVQLALLHGSPPSKRVIFDRLTMSPQCLLVLQLQTFRCVALTDAEGHVWTVPALQEQI